MSATVAAKSAPAYVSIMAHSKVNAEGIPDETDQVVLECGEGITKPGCTISQGSGEYSGEYTVESTAPLDARHPYRVLYVQWAPGDPEAGERWVSWQLPTG
ncbi:hypothetical protein [Streptoalloteichus hindustanus]|uniref:Uncharacterized protein n=1 Tax=Streptoalloteichus hindustanus TaxID=2017 RepID=A0A1M5MS33_STRHI|nr:hypothetical protein [Streptoalloteichus hindustanus]SHG80174.1 hypothetical protein SAMN05444320_11430 [Streptoalloteichus hindustanus]